MLLDWIKWVSDGKTTLRVNCEWLAYSNFLMCYFNPRLKELTSLVILRLIADMCQFQISDKYPRKIIHLT